MRRGPVLAHQCADFRQVTARATGPKGFEISIGLGSLAALASLRRDRQRRLVGNLFDLLAVQSVANQSFHRNLKTRQMR